MHLDASVGGSIQNKTPSEVGELIEIICQSEYNKHQEEGGPPLGQFTIFQIEEDEHKEQQDEMNQIQGGKVAKEQVQQLEEALKAQTKHFESIIAQLAKSLERQHETANAQIRQLTKQ
ncbi:hypothetical protein A2U01_0046026, partial [Trifolium medium]|nr:hypothetical protein [Trifolium medium]